MNPKIDVITLGVTDLDQARQFYERGFGAVVPTQHRARAACRLKDLIRSRCRPLSHEDARPHSDWHANHRPDYG